MGWDDQLNVPLILTTDTVHGKFVEPIAPLPNDTSQESCQEEHLLCPHQSAPAHCEFLLHLENIETRKTILSILAHEPPFYSGMACKSPTAQLQLGTRIDGGALELVEVLGVGGYGVVYRAVETYSFNPKSYAVKCLMHNHDQPSMRRQIHIREIALHQLSSAHHGVVTLHRVIEDHSYTYIILDYAPDHDLFTQILNNCRYLGNDALIKHVFLQLVDAVEYCHSLGIYHRDLKPENILCFDNGSRIAITDFGLATTEKVSAEMRTGSIYHMSPGEHTF